MLWLLQLWIAAAQHEHEHEPGCVEPKVGNYEFYNDVNHVNIEVESKHGPVINRHYNIYVPEVVKSGQELRPLVMVYHPWLGGMLSEQAASHWVTVAHQHGFVVAFLEGMSDFTNPDGAEDDSLRGWNCGHLPGDCSANATLRFNSSTEANDGRCAESCSKACHADPCIWATCEDDGVFSMAVLNDIKNTVCIDPSRVYGAGYSNGGMMVLTLAARGFFNAAAVVSSAPACNAEHEVYTDVEGNETLPMMLISGLTDDVIPPEVGCAGDHRAQFTDCPDWCTAGSDGWFYAPQSAVIKKHLRDGATTQGSCGDAAFENPTEFDTTNVEGIVECHTYGERSQDGCEHPIIDCNFNGDHYTTPTQYAFLMGEFFSAYGPTSTTFCRDESSPPCDAR